MKLRDLLADSELDITVVAGEPAQLDRTFRSVMTTDLPDPRRYLAGGELVLTGMVWWSAPGDAGGFVAALAEGGVAGLAAGEAYRPIPDDLVTACQQADIPLLRVPADVSFAAVTERVKRRLDPQHAEDLAGLLGRHRRLVEADTAGQDWLADVLELVCGHLDRGCAVLGPTGNVIAAARLDLPAAVRSELAREYLAGTSLPVATEIAGRTASLYGIGAAFASRLTGWFLVFDGNCTEFSTEEHRLAGELAALLATGYRRLTHRRASYRSLADEIVRQACARAEAAELQPRLELAGLAPAQPMFAVAARLHEDKGPSGQGSSRQVPSGRTAGGDEPARLLLEELLEAPVAEQDGIAFALTPACRDGSTLERLRAEVDALAPGVGSGRLSLGVSAVVTSAEELHGALDEARYACQLSGLRGGQVTLTGHEDLSSHMMLLAAVPDDVRRSFRERVLGPVLDYDRAHGTELVPTLRAFLDNSGSWTQCARALHLHVNTLRYRIQRVEQLTGRALTTVEARVDFFLALSLE